MDLVNSDNKSVISNLLQWIRWLSKFLEYLFECCWFPERTGKLWQCFYNSLSIRYFLLLFRKPISSVEFHISNELIEVIPSSNPCSQTDIEGHFLLMKKVFKEESTQDKYLKTDYATEFKEQWQGKMFKSQFSNFLWSPLVNFHIFCAWSLDVEEIIGQSQPLQLLKL